MIPALSRTVVYTADAARAYIAPAVKPEAELKKIKESLTPLSPPQVQIISQDPSTPIASHSDADENLRLSIQGIANRVSALTALLTMCSWAGVESRGLALMNIADKVTKDKTLSLWDEFKTEYETLSLFAQLKALIVYLTCYKTSLISNTVEAYAYAFFGQQALLKDLNYRNIFFKKLLDNMFEFSSKDLNAARVFVLPTNTKTLEVLQKEEIDACYGNDLDKLYKEASKNLIVSLSPQVSFFKDQQELPLLIGYIFKGLQWLINRFIIQKVMKDILPSSLKATMNSSLGLQHTTYLPFSLALNNFLIGRLDVLQRLLDNPRPRNPKEKKKFEGIQRTISELKKVLGAENLETKETLTTYLQKIEKPSFNPIDKKTDEAIEAGIIEAVNALFDLLDSDAESGELVTNLLNSTSRCFETKVSSIEQLKADYEKSQKTLEEKLQHLGGRIVDDAMQERFKSFVSEDDRTWQTEDFNKKKQSALSTVKNLITANQELLTSIGTLGPIDKSMDKMLTQFLTFAENEQLASPIPDSSNVEMDRFNRSFTPILKDMNLIINGPLKTLRELQGDYETFSEALPVLTELPKNWQTFNAPEQHPAFTQLSTSSLLLTSAEQKLSLYSQLQFYWSNPLEQIPFTEASALLDKLGQDGVDLKSASGLSAKLALLQTKNNVLLKERDDHLQKISGYEDTLKTWSIEQSAKLSKAWGAYAEEITIQSRKLANKLTQIEQALTDLTPSLTSPLSQEDSKANGLVSSGLGAALGTAATYLTGVPYLTQVGAGIGAYISRKVYPSKKDAYWKDDSSSSSSTQENLLVSATTLAATCAIGGVASTVTTVAAATVGWEARKTIRTVTKKGIPLGFEGVQAKVNTIGIQALKLMNSPRIRHAFVTRLLQELRTAYAPIKA